ncbi:MAG: hypothetical protein Q8K96_06645 [Rubrivivax sp.]|nr:hypothetical protein [Rubrivivax sp.]
MKLLQSVFARKTTQSGRAPASLPQQLDAASLKQVSGGLPRVSSPVEASSVQLPRVS